jgi:hypothetical protein
MGITWIKGLHGLRNIYAAIQVIFQPAGRLCPLRPMSYDLRPSAGTYQGVVFDMDGT